MKSLLILGGGGHAKVVVDALLAAGAGVAGFLDRNPDIQRLLGIDRLGDADPETFGLYSPAEILLVNGFGSTGRGRLRAVQYERWKERGFQFATVIHPSAIVSAFALLEEGVQIMAGAVIQAGCVLGENALLNTSVVVDHDCRIGKHAHVATGAALSGGVQVGDGAHVGTGVSVIQGIKIGTNSVVGAGSVVVRDVPADCRVMGVPAHHNTVPAKG